MFIYINNFDAIRGWAALLVVIAHVPNINQPSFGASGVWLFFVLSGFLLYLSFENSNLKELASKTPTYLYKRAFRLVPTYYVTIIGYAIAYTFIYNVSMLGWSIKHGLFIVASGHFWSVKVEIIFYLILPLSLIFIAVSKNNVTKSLVSLTMIPIIYYLFEFKKIIVINAASAPDLSLFLTPFYIGIFLAINRHTFNQGVSTLLFYVGFFFLVFLSLDFPLFLTLREALTDQAVNNMGWRYPYIMYFFAGMAVLGAYKANSLILNNKAIISLGTVAYSFYLWHILVITLVEKVTNNTITALTLSILGSYVLSYFSYKYVEKPSMNYPKKHPLSTLNSTTKILTFLDKTLKLKTTNKKPPPISKHG